ncbi:MAG: hypothetical protein COA99_06605 [Moraxellaceae bacterium]|nr:MAG: hypothetical protein COA99_06605 [Moraxellaceae bacterium]
MISKQNKNGLGRLRKAVGAAALMTVSGMASAVPVELQLEYSCLFPVAKQQDLILNVTTDIPEQVVVGEVAGPYELNISAHFNGSTYVGLNQTKGGSFEGTVDFSLIATGPGGYLNEMEIDPEVRQFYMKFSSDWAQNGFDILVVNFDGSLPTTPAINDFTLANVGTAVISIEETMSMRLKLKEFLTPQDISGADYLVDEDNFISFDFDAPVTDAEGYFIVNCDYMGDSLEVLTLEVVDPEPDVPTLELEYEYFWWGYRVYLLWSGDEAMDIYRNGNRHTTNKTVNPFKIAYYFTRTEYEWMVCVAGTDICSEPVL